MRTKILALRNNLVSISNTRKYASKHIRCDAHMNELPVPCGPWDPWYKDKQSYYNKILFLGVSCQASLWSLEVSCLGPFVEAVQEIERFLFSLGMAIYTESIYLNFGPPAQPGPPSDMVEECDDSE